MLTILWWKTFSIAKQVYENWVSQFFFISWKKTYLFIKIKNYFRTQYIYINKNTIFFVRPKHNLLYCTDLISSRQSFRLPRKPFQKRCFDSTYSYILPDRILFELDNWLFLIKYHLCLEITGSCQLKYLIELSRLYYLNAFIRSRMHMPNWFYLIAIFWQKIAFILFRQN